MIGSILSLLILMHRYADPRFGDSGNQKSLYWRFMTVISESCSISISGSRKNLSPLLRTNFDRCPARSIDMINLTADSSSTLMVQPR